MKGWKCLGPVAFLYTGDQGRFANAKNLLSQHARFLLEDEQAKAIVSEMTEQVRASCYDIFRGHGFTEKYAVKINGDFVYESYLLDYCYRVFEDSPTFTNLTHSPLNS